VPEDVSHPSDGQGRLSLFATRETSRAAWGLFPCTVSTARCMRGLNLWHAGAARSGR